MEIWEQKNLLVNIDKKIIMEPNKLILSGGNTMFELSFVHPQMGNPFQYELFHLLMDEWKGDRITLTEDTKETRKYLTEEEGCTYRRKLNQTVKCRTREEGGFNIVTIPPAEGKRLIRKWEKFVNQYVLINYDLQLFMTIDKRLFRSKKSMMPYFCLAQAEEMKDSSGSWAGHRIGVEPIDSPTLDSIEYIEMFRMIGDKSLCRLEVEMMEELYGLRR